MRLSLFGYNVLDVSFGKGRPFYPLSSFGSSFIGSKTPVLVDTSYGRLGDVVRQTPHLRAAIERKAEMTSNARVGLRKIKTGEEVLDHEILALLDQPNPLQSLEKFLYQWSIMQDIYAATFIYQLKPLSISTPKVLSLLPSSAMEIVPTGRFYDQFELSGIIQEFRLKTGNGDKKYEVDQVIFNNSTLGGNPLEPTSKIEGLVLPISNLKGAYQTRNVIINSRGAIGMLVNKGRDEAGAIPVGKEVKKEINERYLEQYGIGQGQQSVMITEAFLDWVPMSYPVKDLMLFEEVEDDFAAILGAYGMARDLFPSVKGATFENQQQALKGTYQNTIQPAIDALMRSFNKSFGLTDKGYELYADYSHLPCMQEDEQKKQAVMTSKVIALSTLLRDGVIDKIESRNLLGLPEKQFEAEQATADRLASAQAQLRGTVGAFAGTAQINELVAQGAIDRPTAVAIFMTLLGVDQSEAEAMVTNIALPPKAE